MERERENGGGGVNWFSLLRFGMMQHLKSLGGVWMWLWDTCEIRFLFLFLLLLSLFLQKKYVILNKYSQSLFYILFSLCNVFWLRPLWIFSFLGSLSKFSILTNNRSSVKYRKPGILPFFPSYVSLFWGLFCCCGRRHEKQVWTLDQKGRDFLVLFNFPSVSGIGFLLEREKERKKG